MVDLTDHQKTMLEVWHRHVAAEFELKDPDATIATMTDDAYIFNIPIGQYTVGREALREFYRTQFLCVIPDDCKMERINTIVGENHILEEFIFSFTHDREMPWHVPGIPPTNRYCEMIMMVLIGFEGDKIAYEHLMWDHAGVLYQLGIISHPVAAYSIPQNNRIRQLNH